MVDYLASHINMRVWFMLVVIHYWCLWCNVVLYHIRRQHTAWDLLVEILSPTVGWFLDATFHQWNRIAALIHGLQRTNQGFQWFRFASCFDTFRDLCHQQSSQFSEPYWCRLKNLNPATQSNTSVFPKRSKIWDVPPVSGLHGCLQFHLLSGSHHGQTLGSLSQRWRDLADWNPNILSVIKLYWRITLVLQCFSIYGSHIWWVTVIYWVDPFKHVQKCHHMQNDPIDTSRPISTCVINK